MSHVPDMLVTTYIEMSAYEHFKPAYNPQPGVEVRRMDCADVSFYRFLYQSVGGDWRWRDRLELSDEALAAILCQPTNHVYVLYVEGAPAGYIELEQQGDHTEVAYFGLRKPYMGRGLGKHLLSYGIEKAWQLGTSRIWLHTCNLDSPRALDNYLKRGFRVYMTQTEAMPNIYSLDSVNQAIPA